MSLEEIDRIQKHINETELIEIVETIGDKIIFRGYQEEEVICLVKTLLKLDFLSMEYKTREEVLSVLCDAVSYYNISSKVDWDIISNVTDQLEPDLREYVVDFLHV